MTLKYQKLGNIRRKKNYVGELMKVFAPEIKEVTTK